MGKTVIDIVLADGTDPGVKPTWKGLPPGVRTFLVEIVGGLMNIGLIAGVAVAILGVIAWGFASFTRRPGVAAEIGKVIVVAIVVAVLCVGANNLISFFAGKGATVFS